MHIVMNMSSYEIESNSAQEKNAGAMFSADVDPADVHLCLAEHFFTANKLTILPEDLAVANPDLFLLRMESLKKMTERI
jgi:hypothetical protein